MLHEAGNLTLSIVPVLSVCEQVNNRILVVYDLIHITTVNLSTVLYTLRC